MRASGTRRWESLYAGNNCTFQTLDQTAYLRSALVLELVSIYNSPRWASLANRLGVALKALLLTGLFTCCLLLPFAGCSPAVRTPQLLHPGPAPFQRHNATQFDPYPQIDVGPEIVGGRPIDFQKPANEVERARQYRDQQSWRTGPLY